MRYENLTEKPEGKLLSAWSEFLTQAVDATHYTTPNYFADPFVRGGERFCILSLDDNEQVTGVLTGIDCGKKIFSGLNSRPQIAFVRGVDRRAALLAILNGLREKGGDDLEWISFYSWQKLDEATSLGLAENASGDETSVIMLDLAAGADEIFRGFSQTRRNEIRKAEKSAHLEIKELETQAELVELYAIHRDWNERKGNRPDSFEEIKLAIDQKENRKVFIAKYESKVVAGSFYRFCKGGIVEYAANNSLIEFQKFRPNDLVGWHAIKWACEQGFSKFSMGGSHLFLRRFGGKLVPTYRYTLDLTFLKRHRRKEKLQEHARRTYLSLPDSLRHRIKSFRTT